MSYAASKDREDGSYIARGGLHAWHEQRRLSCASTKTSLGEWTLPGSSAPSYAQVKASVQRNRKLNQPESHLGGEYHASRAESI